MTSLHPHFQRQELTDPITGTTLTDTEGYPWIQEGDPDDGLTIYFESEDSMNEYAKIALQQPEKDLRVSLSNDIDEGYAEG